MRSIARARCAVERLMRHFGISGARSLIRGLRPRHARSWAGPYAHEALHHASHRQTRSLVESGLVQAQNERDKPEPCPFVASR